jgi:outer membrane protein assembly factor BamA
MRSATLLLLLVLLLLGAPPPAHSQSAESYAGRPVTAVRLFINRAATLERALVDLVETRPGQPLSMAAVRESISHLFTLGRFQDVQVEAVVDGPGGEKSKNKKNQHEVILFI